MTTFRESQLVREHRAPRLVLALGTALMLGLTACSQIPNSEPENFGNAQPVSSPPSPNPAGVVYQLPSEFAQVVDMEATADDVIAVRSVEKLAIGTLEQFQGNQTKVFNVDKQCGDLSANETSFVLPCPNGVYVLNSQTPELDDLRDTEKPTVAAALTSTGELVVSEKDASAVTVYRDGAETKKIDVSEPVDHMISVPVKERYDAVVIDSIKNTTIQDIDLPNNRQGGALRVGRGIAQMAPGEDGLVIVSDAGASQLAIYNADDIIRLQMTLPVAGNPWGVAWDAKNSLAWVSTLADNEVIGYQISEGVPQEKIRKKSVADAQNILVLKTGTVVVASATGSGLQVI